jgi:hypothetical protein
MAKTGEEIFTGLQIIMDEAGRPHFVLPVDLPENKYRVQVTDKALDFYADDKQIGHIKNVDDVLLLWVSQQKEVGLISWSLEAEKRGDPCPDTVTQVATVEDKPAATDTGQPKHPAHGSKRGMRT